MAVNKSGFGEAKAEKIEVRVAETRRVTIALKPGTVSETVQISAQVASVETTNATTTLSGHLHQHHDSRAPGHQTGTPFSVTDSGDQP